MSSDCAPEMFPEDMLTEILQRLSVKTLLRIKSVSKLWFSLISSPNFINSHLAFAKRPGADESLIFYTEETSMSLLHLDSLQIGPPLGDFTFVQPFFKPVGFSNGIVCFWHALTFHQIKHYFTYLWNPATRQCKLIPPHNIGYDKISAVSIGFGFDPIGNDYKVVTILSYLGKPHLAEVYSANTNVWRKVEPNPIGVPCGNDFDVCVNGFLCCEGWCGMMAFDLNKEVFTFGIKLPEVYAPFRITDLNDSIVVIASKEYNKSNMFNLWTLDDEACLRDSGVEASWTLLLSIDVGLPVECVFGYFNNGDLLLNTEDNVSLLYNTYKKEARSVPVSLNMSRTLKYNESLVSITGFKQVIWNAHEDDN